ncbi:exopolyphosphatase [Desulfosarcina sp. OttesenSCG-928-A07]|nr:exopolyphosphatase [Desulfosarcina sp. OttesenSCG-928-A07]
MRVVTRPDFDGVVCAVLLMDALDIAPPVCWVQPSDMQHGRVDIQDGDVIANLPYHEKSHLWFDHHISNEPDKPIKGHFKLAPSAAGIIFEHYQGRFKRDYRQLVHETDRIDSADLTLDEILHPEAYPFILLSMTLSSDPSEQDYWEHLVALLRTLPMDEVMQDEKVSARSEQVVTANLIYEKALKENTRVMGRVSVTDFRRLNPTPTGNRFLVYSLFPQCAVNVKITYENEDTASIQVGHSILNRGCRVNVGKMLGAFEGGGHYGAGACRFPREKETAYLQKIIAAMQEDEPG